MNLEKKRNRQIKSGYQSRKADDFDQLWTVAKEWHAQNGCLRYARDLDLIEAIDEIIARGES